MNAEAYRLLTFQAISRMLQTGQPMGAEASLMKLWWSELDVHLNETAQRLVGAEAELGLDSEDAPDDGRWLDGWLFSLAGPIYAGTNEIQRNVVAERVLGLPEGLSHGVRLLRGPAGLPGRGPGPAGRDVPARGGAGGLGRGRPVGP